ncbi:MAG: hypothetical protein FJ087_05075 [Deltaproteobacteria bacterium]|nr:hypothetical protein [Deltaproteobacteria bacterium]
MSDFCRFQDLVTLSVGSGGGEIVQDPKDYLDMADVTSILVRMQVFYLTEGAALFIETSNEGAGPWMEVKTWTGTAAGEAVDQTIQLATHPSGEYPLMRFVRCGFSCDGAAATVTYQATYKVARTS